MLVLSLLLAAAPAPKHFERVKDFDTQNALGDYEWLGDRYVLTERITGAQTGETTTLSVLDLSSLTIETKELQRHGFSLSQVLHSDGQRFWWLGSKNGDQFVVRSSDGASVRIAKDTLTLRYQGAAGGKLTFERDEESNADVRVGTLTLVQVDPAAMTTKDAVILPNARDGGHWYGNTDGTRWVYAEYSELEDGQPPPPVALHVCHTPSGDHYTLPAPVTVYGAAFTLDDTTLYFGSNQLGTIHKVDLATKTLTQVAKGHRGIQRFELTPNGKILLVFTRGGTIARYSVSKEWKALKALKIADFMNGKPRYSWDWTRFSPNRKLVLISKNKLEGTLDYYDQEHPGFSIYKFSDE